jgi:hypothetical protein
MSPKVHSLMTTDFLPRSAETLRTLKKPKHFIIYPDDNAKKKYDLIITL